MLVAFRTPCQRRAPELTREAPRLSDDFWQADVLVEAAAERHFGKLLVAYRKLLRPEPTQALVAQWLGLTQGQISRIERSAIPARDLDKLDRWAQVMHIPERLLWFSLTARPATTSGEQADLTAPHAPTDYDDGQDSVDAYTHSERRSIVQAQSPAEGDGVHRRQFIKSAGVGLTAVGASLLAGTVPSPNRRVSRIRPDASTEIREMTQVFRRLDNRYGGGHSRSVASSYLNSTVTPLLQESTSGAGRSDLFAAAAELHHLAGWMAYDTGQQADGHTHLRQALRLCHEADDERLASEMLAGMSHQAAFHGAPDSAVDLALAAQHSAKRSGSKLLQAEAAVMEAHGLALQGDKTGCLAALSRAEDAFNKSDAEARPHWLTYFDHAYLAAKFAHAFRDLGLPGDAEPFARRSLEMTEGYERGRLFNTALLATVLADQRRLEESCALGMEATTLATSVRSMRGTSYLQDLGAHLAPYQSVKPVSSLFESMIEIGVSPLDEVSRPGTRARAAGRPGRPPR